LGDLNEETVPWAILHLTDPKAVLAMNSAGLKNRDYFAMSGRLWSLWDIMINFHIHGLCLLLRDILEKERSREATIAIREAQRDGLALKNVSPVPLAVNDDDKDKIKDILKYALKCADTLDLQAVRDRIDHFNRKLNRGISNNDFLAELQMSKQRQIVQSIYTLWAITQRLFFIQCA
jgi:hypothetical protein